MINQRACNFAPLHSTLYNIFRIFFSHANGAQTAGAYAELSKAVRSISVHLRLFPSSLLCLWAPSSESPTPYYTRIPVPFLVDGRWCKSCEVAAHEVLSLPLVTCEPFFSTCKQWHRQRAVRDEPRTIVEVFFRLVICLLLPRLLVRQLASVLR